MTATSRPTHAMVGPGERPERRAGCRFVQAKPATRKAAGKAGATRARAARNRSTQGSH